MSTLTERLNRRTCGDTFAGHRCPQTEGHEGACGDATLRWKMPTWLQRMKRNGLPALDLTRSAS